MFPVNYTPDGYWGVCSLQILRFLPALTSTIPFIHLICLRKLMSSNFSYFLLIAKICRCFMTLANTKRGVINYSWSSTTSWCSSCGPLCPWNHCTLTQHKTTALVFAWSDTSEKDFAITSWANSSVCLFLCSLGNWNAFKTLLLS